MQMRQRGLAALDAKYTKELADAKAGGMRDDVAAGRRQFATSKQSVDPVREATASGVDNASLPDWQDTLNGIIHPQRERLITMQKQLEDPEVY